MTATPWGEAERLAERKLPPGRSRDREQVVTQQRERAFGAMVAVVAEKGYEATRVEDVLVVAGMSRNGFYKLFSSKRDCFIQLLEETARLADATVLGAFREAEGSWDVRLQAMLDALARVLVAQPALARVAWLEYYAAGPRAIAVVEQIDRAVEDAVASALDESPERAGMPRDIVRALVGAVRKLVHDRVRTDRIDELPRLMGELFEWLCCYRTPPEPLRRPTEIPPRLRAAWPEPATARDRIMAAVIELVAEQGYHDTAITEIASRASVSLTTFYQQFDGKEDAFLAAFWSAQQTVYEIVSPHARGEREWERSVTDAGRAFAGCMATMPQIGQLGGFAIWATSPAAMDLRARALDAFKAFLDAGFEKYPDTPASARDGIAAAVDALLFDTIRHRGAEHLFEAAPTATFLTLTPFVGSERACELANAGL